MLPLINTTADGKSMLPDWIIRLIASAFLMGAVSWGTWVTHDLFHNSTQIDVLDQRENDHFKAMMDKLNQIDAKVGDKNK